MSEDEKRPAQFDVDAFGFPDYPSYDDPYSDAWEDSLTVPIKAEEEPIRTRSRIVTRPLKYDDYLTGYEEEEESIEKKNNSKAAEKKDMVVPQKRRSSSKGESRSNELKMNNEDSKDITTDKNELMCPECEYRSTSAIAWEQHLKRKHSITPVLAGCLLRCDCGHESYSFWHSRRCHVSNFTIIRTYPTVTPLTPQCALCEKHPTTICGYTVHLERYHKSSLKANGIFLLCSCRFKYTNHNDYMKHDKKCSGQDFTVHKLDED